MRFILNISFLNCQHRRDVVQSNADSKCELEFSGLVVPGLPSFPQGTMGPFKITRTEVYELSWINEVLLLDPMLKSFQNNRLVVAKSFQDTVQTPV